MQAWLAQHPRVHFHYTPTSASWLNQVEGFFGILGKQSLSLTDFYSTRALRTHLSAYMRAWNLLPRMDQAGPRDHPLTPSHA